MAAKTLHVKLEAGEPKRAMPVKDGATGRVTFQNLGGGAGDVYVGVNSKTEGYRIRSGRAVTLNVGKGEEVWLWTMGGGALVCAGPPWM